MMGVVCKVTTNINDVTVTVARRQLVTHDTLRPLRVLLLKSMSLYVCVDPCDRVYVYNAKVTL
jgi:hypothetical protein